MAGLGTKRVFLYCLFICAGELELIAQTIYYQPQQRWSAPGVARPKARRIIKKKKKIEKDRSQLGQRKGLVLNVRGLAGFGSYPQVPLPVARNAITRNETSVDGSPVGPQEVTYIDSTPLLVGGDIGLKIDRFTVAASVEGTFMGSTFSASNGQTFRRLDYGGTARFTLWDSREHFLNVYGGFVMRENLYLKSGNAHHLTMQMPFGGAEYFYLSRYGIDVRVGTSVDSVYGYDFKEAGGNRDFTADITAFDFKGRALLCYSKVNCLFAFSSYEAVDILLLDLNEYKSFTEQVIIEQSRKQYLLDVLIVGLGFEARL